MLTIMKRTYQIPIIRIQSIDAEDGIMEASIPMPIYDEHNPNTVPDNTIKDGSEVLGNSSSVWGDDED